MSVNLEDKKLFLIVSESEKKLRWYYDVIERHFGKPTIFNATDGLMALSKLENAPPHLLVIDVDLPKMTGLQVVDRILEMKELESTAIVLIGKIPEKERYLDELVTGKIQFLSDEYNESEATKCLAKGLNFSSHKGVAEFYLKFLTKGDVLLKEGDKADFVYFVKKGQLRAFKQKDGSELTLGYIDFGEFVGEMAYINGEPRSANVDALTDCELIEVPVGTFEKVLFSRPSWSKALMTTLSKRVKAANEKKSI